MGKKKKKIKKFALFFGFFGAWVLETSRAWRNFAADLKKKHYDTRN